MYIYVYIKYIIRIYIYIFIYIYIYVHMCVYLKNILHDIKYLICIHDMYGCAQSMCVYLAILRTILYWNMTATASTSLHSRKVMYLPL